MSGHVAAVQKDVVQLLRVSQNDTKVVTETLGEYGMGANTAEGFVWSADGAIFAVINKELGVDVYTFQGLQRICSIPALTSRGFKNMAISPKNNFLIAAESAVVQNKGNCPKENAVLYHIPSKDKKLGNLRVRKLTEPFWPAMRWTDDEKLCFRVLELQDIPANALTSEMSSLASNSAVIHLMNTKSSDTRLVPVPGLTAIATAPGSSGRVCCFFGRGDELRRKHRATSYVEIFEFASAPSQAPFRADLADPADSASISWNSVADKILLSATVEVDETGRTYYGRSTLYVLTALPTGSWSMVRAASAVGQPLHDAQWSPADSSVFAAVAGAMPGNAGLFKVASGGQLTQMHSLGSNLPRNTLKYSPSGRFLAVGGFGALPGDVDFWDLNEQRCLTSFRASCTVECVWAPCGARLFAVCTTSPRMRVDNAISVYNYDGTLQVTLPYPVLYAATWRPEKVLKDEPSSPRVLASATEFPVNKADQRKAYKAPRAADTNAFAAAMAAEDERRKRRQNFESRGPNQYPAKPSKWDNLPDRSAAVTPEDPPQQQAAAAKEAAAAVCATEAPSVSTAAQLASFQAKPLSAAKEWYYRDMEGVVQGPFGLKAMQTWCKQGYFSPDLELRVGNDEKRRFWPLRDLFPEPQLAPFKDFMVWPWN